MALSSLAAKEKGKTGSGRLTRIKLEQLGRAVVWQCAPLGPPWVWGALVRLLTRLRLTDGAPRSLVWLALP